MVKQENDLNDIINSLENIKVDLACRDGAEMRLEYVNVLIKRYTWSDAQKAKINEALKSLLIRLHPVDEFVRDVQMTIEGLSITGAKIILDD